MRHKRILLAACALLFAGAPAGADESSERLYSRGLVEFHAGRYAPALALFDAAVAADPRDPIALYYRGVTRGRSGNYAAAADDLRAALALPGHPPRAGLELGVALVEAGDPAAAIAPLQRAETVPELAPRAAFFLGLAQLRQRQLDAAEASFTRAGRGDAALELAAKYYRGVVAYERQEAARSAELFAEVASASPDSEVGREAARFLSVLRGAEQRPYHLFAKTGLQYDSNVTLVVDDPQSTEDREQDGSAVFHVGGDFVPTRDRRATLQVGYDFFQSLHFDVSRYDLQRHRPHLQFTSDLDLVQFGVAGDYEYSLLRADSFLGEWKVMPWVGVPQGQWGRSELFYRFRDRSFKDLDFDALTGSNHSAGLRQLFFLGAPQRFFSLGYRYDNENARASIFTYDGHEVNAGIQGELPARILAQLGYAYRHEDYDREPATATETPKRRRDNEQHVGLNMSRSFLELVTVDLGYFFTFNGSNLDEFQYNRHIVSLTVRVDL